MLFFVICVIRSIHDCFIINKQDDDISKKHVIHQIHRWIYDPLFWENCVLFDPLSFCASPPSLPAAHLEFLHSFWASPPSLPLAHIEFLSSMEVEIFKSRSRGHFLVFDGIVVEHGYHLPITGDIIVFYKPPHVENIRSPSSKLTLESYHHFPKHPCRSSLGIKIRIAFILITQNYERRLELCAINQNICFNEKYDMNRWDILKWKGGTHFENIYNARKQSPLAKIWIPYRQFPLESPISKSSRFMSLATEVQLSPTVFAHEAILGLFWWLGCIRGTCTHYALRTWEIDHLLWQ